jgi:hypothetical protein
MKSIPCSTIIHSDHKEGEAHKEEEITSHNPCNIHQKKVQIIIGPLNGHIKEMCGNEFWFYHQGQ